MDYVTLRRMWKHRNSILMEHNGADGTSNDTSTDPVITRDPNNYLLPNVNSVSLMHGLTIAVAIMAVIILLPMAIKTVKSYV